MFLRETISNLQSDDIENNNKPFVIIKKSLPSATKSKVIVLDSEEDRKYFDECEKFLSTESIMKVISKDCCKKKCIKKISPGYQDANYSESVLFSRCLRKELLGKSKQERADRIFSMLKG